MINSFKNNDELPKRSFFQTQKMRMQGFGSLRPAKNHSQDRLYANFDLEKAF